MRDPPTQYFIFVFDYLMAHTVWDFVHFMLSLCLGLSCPCL